MLMQFLYVGGWSNGSPVKASHVCRNFVNLDAAIEIVKSDPSNFVANNGTVIVEIDEKRSVDKPVSRVLAECILDSESKTLEVVRYDGDEVEVEIYRCDDDFRKVIGEVEPCENACSSDCETALACGEVGVLREYTPPPQVTVHIENVAIQFAKQ